MSKRAGFKAECWDCPTIVGEDYGELIRNGVMSVGCGIEGEAEVFEWAKWHALETHHAVKVSHYMSLDIDASELDRELWDKLTNG